MTGLGPEARTRAAIESWNRSDWSSYRAMTDSAFVHEEHGSGCRMTDIDEVITRWKQLKAVFPDTSAAIVTIESRGPWTIAGVLWLAVQSAPTVCGTELESPSYKRLEAWDVIIMGWRADRLVSEWHRLGVLSLLAPLPGRVLQS